MRTMVWHGEVLTLSSPLPLVLPLCAHRKLGGSQNIRDIPWRCYIFDFYRIELMLYDLRI